MTRTERHLMRRILVAVLMLVTLAPTLVALAEEPAWVDAMRAVHRGFAGQRGYVAQLGDSITYSMAFWTPIGWDEPDQYLTKDDGLAKRPRERRWRDTLQGFRNKGPEHGNYSGWRVGDVLNALAFPVCMTILRLKNPYRPTVLFPGGTAVTAPRLRPSLPRCPRS